MNNSELEEKLRSPLTYGGFGDAEILQHFQQKYASVDYAGQPLFVFGQSRDFNDRDFAIQFHPRCSGYTPYHIFHYVVLTYVYYGTLTLMVEGEQVTLHQDDLIVLDKFVPHGVLPTGGDDIAINIILTDAFFRHSSIIPKTDAKAPSQFLLALMSLTDSHTHYLLLHGRLVPSLRVELQEMLKEFLAPATYTDAIISASISILLMKLTRLTHFHSNLESAPSTTHQLIASVLTYLKHHYREGTLADCCRAINYSPAYVSRMLHQETTQTFKQLQNERRMHRAEQLLHDPKLPIDQIAEQVGIRNLTNFYARFRAYTHLTPQEYREALRRQ